MLELGPLPEWATHLDFEPLRWLARREGAPIVSLDTEATTFVDAATFGIIEVGVVVFRPTGEIEAASTLLDAGQPIHPAAAKVHGLTAAHLAYAPRFPAIATALRAIVAPATVVGLKVGQFDIRGIAKECDRYRLAAIAPKRIADLYAPLGKLEGSFESRALDSVATALGITLSCALHRALPDAVVAAAIASEIVARIGSQGLFMAPKVAKDGAAGAAGAASNDLREVLRRRVEAAMAGFTPPPRSAVLERDVEDVVKTLGLAITHHGRDVKGIDGITVADATGLRARIGGDRYAALLRRPPNVSP